VIVPPEPAVAAAGIRALARPLRAWEANLENGWDDAVRATSAARARIWRLYMAGSALAFESNRIGVNQVLAVKPDGVFVYNDLGALGFQDGLLDRGVRVPEDIAIVGAGDIALGDLLRVPTGPVDLTAYDANGRPGFDGGKKDGAKALPAMAGQLADLQEKLYANAYGDGAQRSVLLVLQRDAFRQFLADHPTVAAKLLGTVLHLHRGTPYVYQGEELGLPEVENIPTDRRQDPMWRRSGAVDPGSRAADGHSRFVFESVEYFARRAGRAKGLGRRAEAVSRSVFESVEYLRTLPAFVRSGSAPPTGQWRSRPGTR